MIDLEYELIKLLNKVNKLDIPVSCIITRNNRIVSKGINNKYSKNNPLGHAEINAIIKATKKLKTTNLKECELYVTLKPCKMCQSIIREMRIKKVYYYIENKKYINDNVKYIKIDNNNNIFKNKIVDFFKNKR